jgi:hypothetical protein
MIRSVRGTVPKSKINNSLLRNKVPAGYIDLESNPLFFFFKYPEIARIRNIPVACQFKVQRILRHSGSLRQYFKERNCGYE